MSAVLRPAFFENDGNVRVGLRQYPMGHFLPPAVGSARGRFGIVASVAVVFTGSFGATAGLYSSSSIAVSVFCIIKVAISTMNRVEVKNLFNISLAVLSVSKNFAIWEYNVFQIMSSRSKLEGPAQRCYI